jgi:hypothetical protein
MAALGQIGSQTEVLKPLINLEKRLPPGGLTGSLGPSLELDPAESSGFRSRTNPMTMSHAETSDVATQILALGLINALIR